jgi:predicted RNA-binding protein YlqC (UPF0109 family)
MAADTVALMDYLVRALVDDADAVEIVHTTSDAGEHFEVTVAPDDVGKVIGRSGRIIKALRTVVRAAGCSDDRRVDVEVLG